MTTSNITFRTNKFVNLGDLDIKLGRLKLGEVLNGVGKMAEDGTYVIDGVNRWVAVHRSARGRKMGLEDIGQVKYASLEEAKAAVIERWGSHVG